MTTLKVAFAILLLVTLSELMALAIMTQIQLEDIERKLARLPSGIILQGEN